MAATLPKARSSTEVQTLDLQMAKSSIGVHRSQTSGDPDDGLNVVSLVLDSLTAIQMSDKEACYYMGFDRSQFSRVKKGEARLPVDALWRLPDLFWFEFRRRVDEQKHLTADSAKQARVARIRELVGLLVEEAAS